MFEIPEKRAYTILDGSFDLNRKYKLILNENNKLEPDRRLFTNDKSHLSFLHRY